MGKGLASATIIGNLGKDPEIRSTSSGKKVASFGLAVEEGFGDKARTDWWDIVVWGELAEFTEKHLKKGKTVSVAGRLQKRSWDDKQSGQKRTAVELNAKDISFFDSGSGGGAWASATPERRETTAPAPRAAASDNPFGEDEPF